MCVGYSHVIRKWQRLHGCGLPHAPELVKVAALAAKPAHRATPANGGELDTGMRRRTHRFRMGVVGSCHPCGCIEARKGWLAEGWYSLRCRAAW